MEFLLHTILRDAKRKLETIEAGNPRLEAEYLLAHAIEEDRLFLLTHPEYLPTDDEMISFEALLGV